MPPKNGVSRADAASRAARHRFAGRLAPPLADPSGTAPSLDHGPEPLLPLRTSRGQNPAEFEVTPEEMGTDPRLRWRTPWRVAILLAVPCLLLLVWFAWSAWAAQPVVEPLIRSSSADGAEGTGQVSAARGSGAGDVKDESQGSQGQQITVHVAGAVKNPGIVKLPTGARVFDAIAAAGGADSAAELNRLNLAAVVQDAAKIHVLRSGEAAVPESDAGTAGGTVGGTPVSGNPGTGRSGDGKLNLNTATAEQLDALPKVGPVLAKRIVEWRQQHGPFAAVEDLDAVDGVGPKMMETLMPLVTV